MTGTLGGGDYGVCKTCSLTAVNCFDWAGSGNGGSLLPQLIGSLEMRERKESLLFYQCHWVDCDASSSREYRLILVFTRLVAAQ